MTEVIMASDFIDPRSTPWVEPRSRGELPHLYKEGGSYFVTFRLLDAVDTNMKKCRRDGGTTSRRRRPNLFVSAQIAAATETKADYIKQRAFDKDYYKGMIVSYLKKFDEAKREDIDKLLLSKLSDALTEEQKKQLIANLLQEMRRDGTIEPHGTTRWAKWSLSKPTVER